MTLPEFRLERYFATWEFRARYNLAASDAESWSVPELLTLADGHDRERWEQLRLEYGQTRGLPALREAIAGTYDRLSPEDILCFAGAQEGLYCAMHSLLGPNDHAVVLVPNYQSMESVPHSICQVTGVPLRADNAWELDLNDVRKALRSNTRVIAVNFPNNPTGKIVSQAVFAELIALCAQRGMFLFSDEVYRGVERDPTRRLPQAADLYDRALSLNVMSKAYGLPGLRVGWIACCDRSVLERMEQLKYYLSICNAVASEVLALIALKARGTILQRNGRLITANLRKLDAFFHRHVDLFEWYEPDGACIAYPRYLGSDGVEPFCARLVQEAGVLLLPGSMYRSDLLPSCTDRFRIGYGRAGIHEALAAFEEFLTESHIR
ncbi:MAG: aminotransferase class I/II-fold pyridoxal phosphate-dependent enzyme [Candidatus Eremiobacteraeota bacterium]|nr:aminotransferase class I/II-fold pyridoxal phosphate-dependent enzyme [Candidatus Eremiobacteraeota bacterium]